MPSEFCLRCRATTKMSVTVTIDLEIVIFAAAVIVAFIHTACI